MCFKTFIGLCFLHQTLFVCLLSHSLLTSSGKKRYRNVAIEVPGQSDIEERELELELEKFSLPAFGESPGGTPSITPPSDQASARDRDEEEVY